MKRTPIILSTLIGASIATLWLVTLPYESTPYWSSHRVVLFAYATCPMIELGLSGPTAVVIPLLNGVTYGLVAYGMLQKRKPAVALVLGYAVAIFWAIAIDEGANGATWTIGLPTWPAFVTCPFTFLVGMVPMTALVPYLNALYYGLVLYGWMALWAKLAGQKIVSQKPAAR